MKSRLPLVGVSLLGLVAFTLLDCGGDDGSQFSEADGGGDDGSVGTDGDPGFVTCDGATCATDGSQPSSTCGDGLISDKEGCDDGNAKSGDGCSDVCQVETGWTCPTVGLRCEAAKCGDGILVGAEECESPSVDGGTGCSATCKILPGFDCDPVTHACAPTKCGNGKIERGETCEDGNALPFDGCFKCQKEPACTNGVCAALCGDGQRFGSEACDDGNTRSGDGCSSTCTVETGYACTDILGTPPDTIDLPILARDFIGKDRETNGAVFHTDFNRLGGTGLQGILATALDSQNKPLLACNGTDCSANIGITTVNGSDRQAQMSSQANFMQWYRDVNGVNRPTVFTAVLQRNVVTGTYVWDSADDTQNGGKKFFDPFGSSLAGWVGQGKETLAPCGPGKTPDRNVSFTSETHFWFEYNGGEKFDFAGDDDTWVFLNGKLVIDLGGLHNPLKGSFTLDADTDGAGGDVADGSALVTSDLAANMTIPGATTGLTAGGIYEVVMFQAERNECGSNFKVTLKDFNKPKSECKSTCGDGKVASDEVCDDGVNDGSYGKCMPGCKARGPRCGDGKVDSPQEACDDGNTKNDDQCTNQCQAPKVF